MRRLIWNGILVTLNMILWDSGCFCLFYQVINPELLRLQMLLSSVGGGSKFSSVFRALTIGAFCPHAAQWTWAMASIFVRFSEPSLWAMSLSPEMRAESWELNPEVGCRPIGHQDSISSAVLSSQTSCPHSLAHRTILFWFFLEQWSFFHTLITHPTVTALQLCNCSQPQFKLQEKRETANSPPRKSHFQFFMSLYNLPAFTFHQTQVVAFYILSDSYFLLCFVF